MAAAWFWWGGGTGGLVREKPAGPLRVGYAVEAPYAYLKERGEVTGESPETARAVAAWLGRGEPEWVLTDFGSLIAELEAGRFDVIAAGLFVTEERAKRVAFSRPTASVGPGLLVQRGNPHRLHAYADAVERAGVKLAALAGAVEAEELKRAGLPAERVVTVPDAGAGLALLRAGRVDGLALSQPTVRWMAGRPESGGEVEAAEPFRGPAGVAADRVAFAFRKKDRRLREQWDEALAALEENGTRARIEREFGFAAAAEAAR